MWSTDGRSGEAISVDSFLRRIFSMQDALHGCRAGRVAAAASAFLGLRYFKHRKTKGHHTNEIILGGKGNVDAP
jgi:hypothetical protein